MSPSLPKMKSRKYDLDFLRICAIIAVVTVHCVAYSTSTTYVDSAKARLFAITIYSFALWCVPVFVMISGALLINDNVYQKSALFLKKRLLRLFPALLAWPFIYEVFHAILYHHPLNFSRLFTGYLTGSPVIGGHLYFLFLIAGLYLLTPVISTYVKLVSRKQLWVTTIALMAATTIWYTVASIISEKEPQLNVITQGLPYVGYFMLGYLLKDVSVRRWYLPFAAYVASSLVVTILTFLTQPFFTFNYFFDYPTIFIMIASTAVFLCGKPFYEKMTKVASSKNRGRALQTVITRLSATAFGVYLVHVIILNTLRSVLNIDKYSVVQSIALIPLVTIISWCVVFAVLRIPYARSLVR